MRNKYLLLTILLVIILGSIVFTSSKPDVSFPRLYKSVTENSEIAKQQTEPLEFNLNKLENRMEWDNGSAFIYVYLENYTLS